QFLDLVFSQTFLTNAVLGGIVASLACGMIGPFVVVKRIGSAAGGIAHSILGGMGAAIYFGFDPMYGALASSVLAAALITLVAQHFRDFEETLINALWAFGMAVGIIFIAKTPGYTPDLNSYLFGNILMATRDNILMSFLLTATIGLCTLILYRPLVAVSFDPE